jgi:hypothetical protein
MNYTGLGLFRMRYHLCIQKFALSRKSNSAFVEIISMGTSRLSWSGLL